MWRDLITGREAARRLGVNQPLVVFLMREHRIPTFRIPVNGSAKGIDKAGRQLLATVTAKHLGLTGAEADRLQTAIEQESSFASSA